MEKVARLFFALLAASALLAFASNAGATNRTFVGTVGLVEVRSAAWGNYYLMTVHDAAGNNITLCDGVTYTYAMGLPFTDASAKVIMALAIAAKLNNLSVTGWGLDVSQTSGLACGIGNLAIM